MLASQIARASDSILGGDNFVGKWCVVALASLVSLSTVSAADDVLSKRDGLSIREGGAARLAAPMTAILDGTTRREAMTRLAKAANVNFWLCRHVDPSAIVSSGSLGPTTFAAIETLARSAECEIQFVAGVVIVGPLQWVDRVAADLMQEPVPVGGGPPVELVDIEWPSLVTPTEAMVIAAGSEDAPASLPHDLWPETHWRQIDRAVATALIRHQFDPLQDSSERLTGGDRNDEDSTAFVRFYQSPDLSTIRKAVSAADPSAKVRVIDGSLEVRGNAVCHRMATHAMLAIPGGGVKRAGAGDVAMPGQNADANQPRFSLRSTTSAGGVIRQLCQAANRKCRIEPDAVEACQKIITIEAKDKTIGELIDEVASLAGVSATWIGDEIRIQTLPRRLDATED